MLSLRSKLGFVRLGHDRKLIERQANMVDTQINLITYKLYGLTAEEIGVLESNVPGLHHDSSY